MNLGILEEMIRSKYENISISPSRHGTSFWLDIKISNKKSLVIQSDTSNEIGISLINSETKCDIDFSGHDEVFYSNDESFRFICKILIEQGWAKGGGHLD